MIRKPARELSHGADVVVSGSYDTASSAASLIGLSSGVAIGVFYAFYKGTEGGGVLSPRNFALYAAGFGFLGWIVGSALFSLFTMGMSQKD